METLPEPPALANSDCYRLEHRWRRVNTKHPLARRLRDRDGDPPTADRQLDQRPIRFACQLDVEGNVGRHISRPLVVPVGECLVPTHPAHATAAALERAGVEVQLV
jgi:hypothetical protein